MSHIIRSPFQGHPLRTLLAFVTEWTEMAHMALAPPLDALLRWFVAAPFIASAVLKLSDWNTALLLAQNEYPVDWMDPVAAAWTGVLVELLGGVAIAVGLGTRFACIALLALLGVIHIEYVALIQNQVIGVFLLWYLVHGPGSWSLDHLVRRGMVDSPVPLAALAVKLFQALRERGGAIAHLAVRLWLAIVASVWALALFGDAPLVPHARSQWLLPILPVDGAAAAFGLFTLTLAVALALGLFVRVVALALIATVVITTGMGFGQHLEATQLVGLLALLVLARRSWLSLDHWLFRLAHRRYPLFEDLSAADRDRLPRVVIVGAGFGGLACANALRHEYCRVTLVDRHNYHLFQPLLYQVATATLSPSDIATPIRSMVRGMHNVRVLLADVQGIDADERHIDLGSRRLEYDYLVLATGARHSYFGRDEWAPYAPGLKQIDDATAVRRKILIAFERAENTDDEAERNALLTFVVVGAGPTGVELAGAIAELARHGMEGDFEEIDPRAARVILVQSGPRVLPAFSEALSARTQRDLERLGVEVRTGSRVLEVDDAGVLVGEDRIPARSVFWAAGVASSPAAHWLEADADRAGRIKTAPDLSIPGHSEIYAVGDTAYVEAWHGQPVPGLAPAAKQAGEYAASQLAARIRGGRSDAPFVYRHLGSMATIGRKAAVADFGFMRLSGAPAWWLWGAVHVAFLANMRSRISVTMDWIWAYLTFRASTRLITGREETPG
ncbi:MAG: FAD-dependent oxidoreductase [Pseudomonadota bacterium]